jgi:chromosome segregation ATPase
LLPDKTKFAELESSYQELEQIKSEYESLKEQLTEERERVNELQNTIDHGTIGLFKFNIFFNFISPFLLDKTKFDELESSYQELQQKYQLLEQIKSEYDSLKESFDTTNLQLKQQQEINDQLKADNNRQHLHLVDRDENIHLLKLDIEHQKQSLSKQQQQLSDILETTTTENKKLKEINLQFENDLKENNQLFFDKSKQADDLDRQLQILNNEYKDFKIKFDQLQNEKNKVKEIIQNFFHKFSYDLFI